MANFLNNGMSTRGQGIVKFAKDDVGHVKQDPVVYQASPEMIAEIEERCRKKYRNEPAPKSIIASNPRNQRSFIPPEPRKLPVRPSQEIETARFRYIECVAAGVKRTQVLDLLSQELDITHHEFYKLLKVWGYRNREIENEAIEEFLRSIGAL